MFDNTIASFCEKESIAYKENVDSKIISTFKIGGTVPIVVYPDSSAQSSVLIKYLCDKGIPYRTVGNCSNILFPDEPLDYVLIKSDRLNTLEVAGDRIICGAGVILAKVASAALKSHLTGMEHLFGIPGTVGGAVVMNAGAYGTEMSQIVCETEYVDANGDIKTLSREEHLFGYRKSFFSESGFVTRTTLMLQNGNYYDIMNEMNQCSLKRISSQPLDKPSAGSVFKRPEGYFAGKLIQDSGLKGRCVGGAQVSEKHAGFIVNTGNATSKDVKELIHIIQDTVSEKFGVMLETEIKIF